MTQSHYSLRWNNHQSHILSAFDALLQAETLVDVTLVCAETSVRAHKVVLSACSPFFQRIFSENPCKHPVIVLKDFHGWEVQAIVDFMYKGEISVGQEQLQNLIKAAESLQVRGLAHQDQLGVDKESNSITNQTLTPSTSPNDYERTFCPSGRFPTPGTTVRTVGERSSPFSPLPGPNYEPPLKLPHMSHPTFTDNLLPRLDCASPLPRRKQARPRRRSGEMCGAQDLSKPTSPPQHQQQQSQQQQQLPPPAQPTIIEETAENLCMKKPAKEPKQPQEAHQQQHHQQPQHHHHLPTSQPIHHPGQQSQSAHHQQSQQQQQQQHQHHHHQQHQHQHQQQMKTETPDPGSPPELDLSMPDKEYATSPPLSLPPLLGMHPEHHMDSHSPLPFPPMPSVSALAMTPPHIFGLDSPLGLFPPGLDGCRNPLLDMTDPRTTPDTPMFSKKKIGRPKGQHSAPRGGPPRSWTNAELTEALQHVWNKKMTTSQASRIFGIPYNSLLMYVRGKYGKSLKLEQLRKDCIGGPGGPLDLLNLGGGNNNNNQPKSDRDRDQDHLNPNTRPPSNEDLPPPMFNPFAPNFYPDFGTGFPIPVSMIHLLPQSEKNRETLGHPVGLDDDSLKKEMEDEHADLFRTPVLSREERRELIQQNGQD